MGKIFTFSGPRGVGKSTVVERLHSERGLKPIIPYTTRDRRAGEVDGRDYHFVTHAEFDMVRRRRGMFDVLALAGNSYGTPMAEIDAVIDSTDEATENHRTFNLAATTALQLKSQIGNNKVFTTFVMPDSWAHLEEQMRKSGVSEAEIKERQKADPTDLTTLPQFDRIILNPFGDKETAYRNAVTFIEGVLGVNLSKKRD